MSYLLDPPTRHKQKADIAVYDRNDEIIAVAEVKLNIQDEEAARKQLSYILRAAGPRVSYGILADVETIQIFVWSDGLLGERLARLSAKDVFSFYSSDLFEKPIYHFYLVTLLVSWLRDLIYHWKTSTPPEHAKMDKIGFTTALSDGFVFTEVDL